MPFSETFKLSAATSNKAGAKAEAIITATVPAIIVAGSTLVEKPMPRRRWIREVNSIWNTSAVMPMME